MPRVSVIIPSYNREHLIKRAIESVFNQTYRDLEIIVCDDGSKDKTVEVVRGMIDNAPLPLRVEMLPQNLGVSAARNWGVYCAQGGLIGFLDSDDTWKPEKLEKQVAFLDARSSYVGVGCAAADVLPDGSEVKNQKTTRGSTERELSDQEELYTMINHNYITTSCFLVKKDALILSGLFDIRLKSSEDRDLWWRLPKFGRVGYINEPLINYMVHDASLSHQFSSATAKTYLPAVMRTVWYWRDKLTKEQIRKIYAKSFMLFAYDSSSAGNHLEALYYAFKALTGGYHFKESSKFTVKQLIEVVKSVFFKKKNESTQIGI